MTVFSNKVFYYSLGVVFQIHEQEIKAIQKLEKVSNLRSENLIRGKYIPCYQFPQGLVINSDPNLGNISLGLCLHGDQSGQIRPVLILPCNNAHNILIHGLKLMSQFQGILLGACLRRNLQCDMFGLVQNKCCAYFLT